MRYLTHILSDNDLQMYHVCDLGKISENVGVGAATISIVLASFYSPSKALEIFPGACPVTDRRFCVCFIRLNTHFGFGKIRKLFIS